MAGAGPTILSLVAAGLYLTVSVLCLRAGNFVTQNNAGRKRRLWWFAIAVLFGLLAMMRILVVEDQMRFALRTFLETRDLYGIRRSIQWPIAIAAAALFSALFWMLMRRFSEGSDRRGRALQLAQLAAFAMVALVALRLISLGPIDYILDGPLRVNWWIDIGSSLAVAVAAWRFAQR